MSIPRLASLFLFASLSICASLAQQPPTPRIVSLSAPDGTSLKGTFFASTKPGPGVLLLHQCNQQRKLWDPLGESLAANGINVLTVDYRGYGESGGTPHEQLSQQDQGKLQIETFPGDVEIAYQYLSAQSGVTRSKIGIGGASCGVTYSIKLAQRHPEVKSLVLLAGPTDREGRKFLQFSKNLPIFTCAADDDIFGPQVLLMQWLFSLSQNPASRFANYASGGHAAEMFAAQKELPDLIASWLVATLTDKAEQAPKTNGAPLDPQVRANLDLLDEPGGAGATQVAKALAVNRQQGASSSVPPEVIVNLLGYEHLQLGDTKGAVEILKVNAVAYPNSPNVYDSLSDAYLADGQKDLALQDAKKALELLANDTKDPEALRNGIRDNAQQKIKQLTPSQP